MKFNLPMSVAFVLATAIIFSDFASASAQDFAISSLTVANASWNTIATPTSGGNGKLYLEQNTTLNGTASNLTMQYNYFNKTLVNMSCTNISVAGSKNWQCNMTQIGETAWSSYQASVLNVTYFIDIGGSNSSIYAGYDFYMDGIAPDVKNYTGYAKPVITNGTYGDTVKFAELVIENNSLTCGFNIWFKDAEYKNATISKVLYGNFSSTTAGKSDCNITSPYGNFTNGTGYYIVEGFVVERSGRIGYTTQNETIIAHSTLANTWNLISSLQEDYLTTGNFRGGNFQSWIQNHSAFTYISMFNSTAQGFVTHQLNTASYNQTKILAGFPYFIYSTVNYLLMRTNGSMPTSIENQTIVNSSASGPYNLVGLPYGDVNVSAMASITTNTSWASFFNVSNGFSYFYARGYGLDMNDVIMIKGSACWIDSNATADINISLVKMEAIGDDD